MASSLALFFTFSLAMILAASTAKEFQVGDSVGWRIPVAHETELYNVWAKRRHFHLGDSLRFRYKNDSVAVVEKWGYFHCDSSNPISFYNDGDTVVNLDKAGPVYFISGNGDHCGGGQRMVVEVMNPHPDPHYPPGIATPPHNPDYATAPSPDSSDFSGPGASSGSVTAVSVSLFVTAFVVGLVVLGLCAQQP